MWGAGRGPSLWTQTIHSTRKSNRLANVVDSANPTHGSLEAEAETSVNERAVLPQIQIPVVSLDRQAFFLYPAEELVVIVLALRSADDLAMTFRRQQIVAQYSARVSRILLHVKRFRLFGIIVDEDGTILTLDQQCLILCAEVITPRHGTTLRLQHFYCIAVVDARKWRLDLLEFRNVALELLQLRLPPLENPPHDVRNEFLLKTHVVV